MYRIVKVDGGWNIECRIYGVPGWKRWGSEDSPHYKSRRLAREAIRVLRGSDAASEMQAEAEGMPEYDKTGHRE